MFPGNLGLQAGSNTIRGLGTGHIKRGEFQRNIGREVKSGVISATIIAITIGVIGALWSYYANDKVQNHDPTKIYPYHDLMFGTILFLGSWISMIIACFNGSCTPLVADICGLDPAKVAGPLETAFQDIFGQTFLLGMSLLVFSATEPYFWFVKDSNGDYNYDEYS